jgi:hypothetical protein
MVDCDDCVTGQEHLTNLRRKDSHEISFHQFIKEETLLGAKCVCCIHNKIGKRKSKIYKKINAGFQSVDLFKPVKKEK